MRPLNSHIQISQNISSDFQLSALSFQLFSPRALRSALCAIALALQVAFFLSPALSLAQGKAYLIGPRDILTLTGG
ncbi:MAG: hypothetical protein JRE23_07375 [Deltaproteobacteria bacterium]|nr:hypothetical protein [Deltaproteobacteria bacterium]